MTQYYFGDKSRRKLKDVIRRVDAGRRSSRPTPTRRIPRHIGGALSAEFKQAILFKTLDPCTKTIVVGEPVNTTTVEVTPGELEEECVIPIADDPEIAPDERTPTDPRVEIVNEDDETIVYDAVNGCSDFPIVAGDGSEELDEMEVGTGFYNEPPVLVEGYLRTYIEGDPPEEKQVFVVTDVINPCVIYEATLDAELADTDTTFEVTPADDIWGKRPVGKRTVVNAHGWAADVGATVTVLRGYDRDYALNIDCPA